MKFKVGDQVFPLLSQRLPAYQVVFVGSVTITVVDGNQHREVWHKSDAVVRDPAVVYSQDRYAVI